MFINIINSLTSKKKSLANESVLTNSFKITSENYISSACSDTRLAFLCSFHCSFNGNLVPSFTAWL